MNMTFFSGCCFWYHSPYTWNLSNQSFDFRTTFPSNLCVCLKVQFLVPSRRNDHRILYRVRRKWIRHWFSHRLPSLYLLLVLNRQMEKCEVSKSKIEIYRGQVYGYLSTRCWNGMNFSLQRIRSMFFKKKTPRKWSKISADEVN